MRRYSIEPRIGTCVKELGFYHLLEIYPTNIRANYWIHD